MNSWRNVPPWSQIGCRRGRIWSSAEAGRAWRAACSGETVTVVQIKWQCERRHQNHRWSDSPVTRMSGGGLLGGDTSGRAFWRSKGLIEIAFTPIIVGITHHLYKFVTLFYLRHCHTQSIWARVSSYPLSFPFRHHHVRSSDTTVFYCHHSSLPNIIVVGTLPFVSRRRRPRLSTTAHWPSLPHPKRNATMATEPTSPRGQTWSQQRR